MLSKLWNLIKIAAPYLIIVYVVAVNVFPKGFIYVSGDFAQPINLREIFHQFFYVWNDRIAAPGEGGFSSWFAAIPYYAVFYGIPTLIGLNDTQVLSFTLFLFSLLSYFSFKLSINLLFGKREGFFHSLFPLLYAFNTTTLYFFTYTWGFSHQVFLYICIPLLAGLFYKVVTSPELKYVLLFSLVFLLSGSSFANSAFFVSLALFLIVFFALILLTKIVKFDFRLLLRLLLAGFLCFISAAYWLFPTAYFVKEGIAGISEGIFDLTSWLKGQSSSLVSIFMGLPNYKDFFPYKYSFKAVYISAFLPMIAILFLLVQNRKAKIVETNQKLSIVLLGVAVIFSFLLKKLEPPFIDLTLQLFKTPFFTALRSYEKVAVFWPFLIFGSIYGLISNSWLQEGKKTFTLLVFCLALAAPLPFFIGGIQKNFSITFDETKNYLTAEYSGLVRVPGDYLTAAEYLNSQGNQHEKAQGLPFSRVNTVAWLNYPKWKMVGLSPVDNYFDKPIISQNASIYLLNGWNPAEDLTYKDYDPVWYVRMLSLFNVSHIIYHNDVGDKFIEQSKPKIEKLEVDQNITEVYSNPTLSIFSVNSSLRLGPVFIPNQITAVYGRQETMPSILLDQSFAPGASFVFMKKNSRTEDFGASNLMYIGSNEGGFPSRFNTWEDGWPWPNEQYNANTILFHFELLREKYAERKAYDVFQKVNIKLIHASMRAAELRYLSNEDEAKHFEMFRNKLREIVGLLESVPLASRGEQFDSTVVRVESYLNRISQEYSVTPNLKVLYSDSLSNFLEWVDQNNHCLEQSFCYKLDVPIDGEYRVLLQDGVLGSLESSPPEIYLRDTRGKTASIESKPVKMGFHVELATLTLKADELAHLNIVLKELPNLVSSGDWKEYQHFLASDEGVFLRPQVLGVSNPRYKEITNWEPNERYKISFDYRVVRGKGIVAVVEDNSDEQNPGTRNIVFKQELEEPEFSAVGGGWRHIDKEFNSSRNAQIAYLFLSGSTGQSLFGDTEIKNLRLQKVLDPPLLLKMQLTTPDFKTGEKSEVLSVKKLSPIKYEVLVTKGSSPYTLVLNETFNEGWEAFKEVNGGRKMIGDSNHFKINGYSNAWVVDPNTENEERIIIEFWPQALLKYGVLTTLFSFVFMSVWLLVIKFRPKNASKY